MQTYRLVPDDRPAAAPTLPDADEVLAGLNEVQRQAASATDGPVLIIAGPGSGKTRALTHRIAYLVATRKARPSQILAITFTNKAAREMRLRVDKLVGADISRYMAIGTFHATFARVLRKESESIGYTSDFSIYDSDDTQRALRQLMESYHIDPKQFSPRSMYGLISSAKNRLVGPSEYARLAVGAAQEKASKLYQPYQDLLRKSNAMDFDDLLLRPIDLFRQHPGILDRYRDRWQYIHVDEYQDTNHAQYTLTKLLADGHRNLCVVGDDAQSIYAFRGADISNILSFQRDYPEATTVRLEQNYRSSKAIVRLADGIIRNNSRQLDKSLWTDNDEGEPILVIEALSEKDEAQKIERRIRDLCVRRGLRYRDIAVLYRTNAQSRSLEESLRREDVPYRIVGGVSFYQRREIKDALAYLRLAVNLFDTGSLRRIMNVPVRGIGDKSQDLLYAWAEHEGISAWDALQRVTEVPELGSRAAKAMAGFRDMIAKFIELAPTARAGDLARQIVNEAGLMHELMREQTLENLVRRENLEELVSAIQSFTEDPDTENTLSAFLQEVSLLTDADEKLGDDDRVTLMTLHASKGLEFAAVFVTGLEEGLFPLSGAAQNPDDLEEERRLFYVGTTRAERLLYLSYARSRYRYGEQEPALRSRFLDELDPALLRTETGDPFASRQDRFSARPKVQYDTLAPDYFKKSLRPDVALPVRKPAVSPSVGRGTPGLGASAIGPGLAKTSSRPPAFGRGFDDNPEPRSRFGDTEPERRIVYDEEHSSALATGMRVEHALFGEGKVIAMEGVGPQAKATVFFPTVGQKKLVLRLANLRRIG